MHLVNGQDRKDRMKPYNCAFATRFFQHFAQRPIFYGFSIFHKTAWNVPKTQLRFDAAPTKHHFPFKYRQTGDDNFRVLIMYHRAIGAVIALYVFAFDKTEVNWRCAIRAVFHFYSINISHRF